MKKKLTRINWIFQILKVAEYYILMLIFKIGKHMVKVFIKIIYLQFSYF